MIDLALIAEVLGYHAAPAPFLGHALAGIAISRAGSAEQKSKWLPKLVSGEVLATVAFGEGNAVWLPEQWTMPAGKPAGVKSNVPSAMDASLLVVGLAGGELGLVEASSSGVTRSALEGVDRTRKLGEVRFEGAAVELLPQGKEQSANLRDAALVLLAADAFGGARRCVDMAVNYAKEREQFGVKIASFQSLRHQLANMAIETEPMRGLYWYAAHAFDHVPERASYAAALAKAHLTDRYQQVARDAVEAHGGIGYTWEYDIHILLKRAMFDYAFMGAPAVHRARVADMAGW
jgi:alkylation response protein AidB-like acyl-CoA dehydrogenase